MRKTKLTICVVTGSRAEYGLLQPLMQLIKEDKSIQLQILVTGMHLSPEFGLTWKQIKKDGFSIGEKVEMLLSADTDTAIIKSTGLGLMGFADAFQRLQPDWIVLLGDRFETFAAAIAAHLSKIPVAHLHGGELTEGATDDAMRHAITKMAYLHFTAAEVYRKRVIQLGESPERVFNTGAIGLDSIRRLNLLSKQALEKQLQFSLGSKSLLVTYHPATLEKNTAAAQISQLLQALDRLNDTKIIFTLPNADANGRIITERINQYVAQHPQQAKVFTSLGQLRYLSTLCYVSAVVGNSSSGIIEAPFFKIPTVNIGDRQAGRLKAASVIDTGTDTESILKSLKKAFSPVFVATCKKNVSLYGSGHAAALVVKTIKKFGKLGSIKKSFYDLSGV